MILIDWLWVTVVTVLGSNKITQAPVLVSAQGILNAICGRFFWLPMLKVTPEGNVALCGLVPAGLLEKEKVGFKMIRESIWFWMHYEEGLNHQMHADNSVIAHLEFDLFSQCVLLLRSVSDTSIIPSLSLPFLFLCECVDMCVIPEEGKGTDSHRRWSLQDVHDGRSSRQWEREGRGSLAAYTSQCLRWMGRTGGDVCVLWGETRERSRQVSLPAYQLYATGI